uniref:Uncharacterized protein n=1 Tax=Aegilops tauschii TaxID=37682 RepID=M8CAG3_AEGTA
MTRDLFGLLAPDFQVVARRSATGCVVIFSEYKARQNVPGYSLPNSSTQQKFHLLQIRRSGGSTGGRSVSVATQGCFPRAVVDLVSVVPQLSRRVAATHCCVGSLLGGAIVKALDPAPGSDNGGVLDVVTTLVALVFGDAVQCCLPEGCCGAWLAVPCSYASGTQLSWRRLGLVQPFECTLNTGGVVALCSLGCVEPFDCVDGAVSWFGLGWPMPFASSYGALYPITTGYHQRQVTPGRRQQCRWSPQRCMRVTSCCGGQAQRTRENIHLTCSSAGAPTTRFQTFPSEFGLSIFTEETLTGQQNWLRFIVEVLL